jgi:hypothetical protein
MQRSSVDIALLRRALCDLPLYQRAIFWRYMPSFCFLFLAQLLSSEQINSDAMIDDFHLEGSGNKTMQVETPALI